MEQETQTAEKQASPEQEAVGKLTQEAKAALDLDANTTEKVDEEGTRRRNLLGARGTTTQLEEITPKGQESTYNYRRLTSSMNPETISWQPHSERVASEIVGPSGTPQRNYDAAGINALGSEIGLYFGMDRVEKPKPRGMRGLARKAIEVFTGRSRS